MTLPRAYILCFGSILSIILGVVLANFVSDTMSSTCVGLGLLGHLVLFLAGMAVWAGAKGYSPFVGIFLGLFLSLIGLLILVFLPDKNRNAGRPSWRFYELLLRIIVGRRIELDTVGRHREGRLRWNLKALLWCVPAGAVFLMITIRTVQENDFEKPQFEFSNLSTLSGSAPYGSRNNPDCFLVYNGQSVTVEMGPGINARGGRWGYLSVEKIDCNELLAKTMSPTNRSGTWWGSRLSKNGSALFRGRTYPSATILVRVPESAMNKVLTFRTSMDVVYPFPSEVNQFTNETAQVQSTMSVVVIDKELYDRKTAYEIRWVGPIVTGFFAGLAVLLIWRIRYLGLSILAGTSSS